MLTEKILFPPVEMDFLQSLTCRLFLIFIREIVCRWKSVGIAVLYRFRWQNKKEIHQVKASTVLVARYSLFSVEAHGLHYHRPNSNVKLKWMMQSIKIL